MGATVPTDSGRYSHKGFTLDLLRQNSDIFLSPLRAELYWALSYVEKEQTDEAKISSWVTDTSDDQNWYVVVVEEGTKKMRVRATIF